MSKKHVQVTTAVAEITLSNKTKGKEIEMVKLKRNEKGLGKQVDKNSMFFPSSDVQLQILCKFYPKKI